MRLQELSLRTLDAVADAVRQVHHRCQPDALQAANLPAGTTSHNAGNKNVADLFQLLAHAKPRTECAAPHGDPADLLLLSDGGVDRDNQVLRVEAADLAHGIRQVHGMHRPLQRPYHQAFKPSQPLQLIPDQRPQAVSGRTVAANT